MSNKNTFPVSNEIFQQVYDSPHSLPGKHKWLTKDEDVRKIEKLLGMKEKTFDTPLWMNRDHKRCPYYRREINWLDIVSSALDNFHGKEMFARAILGDQKFVNTDNPRAIENVNCFNCKTKIENLCSFRCHNWASARQELLEVIEDMKN